MYNYGPFDELLSFWEFTHFLQDLMESNTPDDETIPDEDGDEEETTPDEGGNEDETTPDDATNDEETPDEESIPDVEPLEAFESCQVPEDDECPNHITLDELEADGCYWQLCYYACTGDALPGTKDEVDSEELE